MLTKFLLKIVIFGAFGAAMTFLATHRSMEPAVLREVTATQVTIPALLAAPDQYANQAVKVGGTVLPGERFSVLGYGGYRMRDASGEAITVLSRAAAPKVNEEITVTGIFKPALQVGRFSFGVIVED